METRSVSEGPWSQPLPEIRPSLTRYEVAHFSREAATAHSRGRQPTEQDENKHVSREAATAHSRGRQPTEQDENKHVSREAAAAEMIAVAASRLEFLCTFLVHPGLSWVCAGIGRIPGFSEEASANAGS
jgi:hypothetical protein